MKKPFFVCLRFADSHKKNLSGKIIYLFACMLIFSLCACSGRSRCLSVMCVESFPPHLESFDVLSSDMVRAIFDKEIAIQESNVFCVDTPENDMSVSALQDGKCAVFSFPCKTELGKSYVLSARVTDTSGSSLSMEVSFDGYNENIPAMKICEIRNAYSSKKNQYEYIKLYCLTDGNLSGLELVSAGDGEDRKYVLPAIDVNAKDYVCVHLRKMKNDDGSWKQSGMDDEINGDMRMSTAQDSSGEAWDLWADNQKSCLSPSDIVVLRNCSDGHVLDAVLFVDPKNIPDAWSDKFAAICHDVEKSGVWLDEEGFASSDVQSAFVAQGITNSAVTRTMQRRTLEDGPSAASDWCVVSARKK